MKNGLFIPLSLLILVFSSTSCVSVQVSDNTVTATGSTAEHDNNSDEETLWAEAIEWQATRGARSGRVAWQYFTDLAGRKGVKLD